MALSGLSVTRILHPHPFAHHSRQVLFASSESFLAAFDFEESASKVRIDVSRAQFWDITAVSALDKAVFKFRRDGAQVQVVGLNEASATLVDRFAMHDKPGAAEQRMH